MGSDEKLNELPSKRNNSQSEDIAHRMEGNLFLAIYMKRLGLYLDCIKNDGKEENLLESQIFQSETNKRNTGTLLQL